MHSWLQPEHLPSALRGKPGSPRWLWALVLDCWFSFETPHEKRAEGRVPCSGTAWLDYLGLESKVSGLCLMNISINHPGCPWNNYLAEPQWQVKPLAQDTEQALLEALLLYSLLLSFAFNYIHAWCLAIDGCLFLSGCLFQCYAGQGCSPQPLRHTNQICQRCKLSPQTLTYLVKCKPKALHLGLNSADMESFVLTNSHKAITSPERLPRAAREMV